MISDDVTGIALRSRVAEGLHDTAAAIRYSSQFMAIYDLPSVAAKPMVDEVRDRLKRLRTTDAAKRR